ncbi:hypothetical protein [Flavobacterium terrisoli]|uniref:hypothetical protein n=1 Tax=Flavobacterium terrisoli TaxID=3242195 RepID=UPI0025436B67|nr:hypothetical protein [Flavobacterium buctense]
MNKNILVIGIQVVLTFLGAFGAILKDILPNEIESKPFIYGITQFSCLFVFLILKAAFFKKKVIKKSHWIAFASLMLVSFLVSSWFFYNHNRKAIILVGANAEKVIIGNELTPRAKTACTNIKKMFPELTLKECQQKLLVEGTADDPTWIWTEPSIEQNEDKFVLFYILLVISLSAGLFSLVELLSPNQTAPENAP